jgi:hypothetical protein
MIKLEEIRAQQTIQELYYKTKSGIFTFSSSKTRKIMIKKIQDIKHFPAGLNMPKNIIL